MAASFALRRDNASVRHLISTTSQWSKQHFLPPHPSPLPQGEGARFPALDRAASARLFSAPEMALPLPEGEGRGEGEVGIGRQRVVVRTRAAHSFVIRHSSFNQSVLTQTV